MSGTPDPRGIGLDDVRALFDEAFYRRGTPLAVGEDAFRHYLGEGARRGLKPNVVFEPQWYLARNPEAAGRDPLQHYALVGEAADRDPSPLFDVAFYRRTYGADRPLAHYLAHRFGPFSPVPEFDAAFYLKTYPDVGEAGLDPFQHYLLMGFREFRLPSEGLAPRLYALRQMRDARGENPVAHMRAQGAKAPPEILRSGGAHAAARAFTRRGDAFEAPAPASTERPRALIVAFHLPQFHRIPENDAWWGPGFTEWTALARGQPRFEGHYQPRIPGELGFYDLTGPATLKAQAALARGAGIGAFVFYHYDFGAKRLLQAPVNLFLATPDVDIGFCLMWANENWTRRWDGAENDLLIAQDYSPALEAARLADFARHFRDPRYLRLEGRPVLMVYRASLIPETAATMARWRRLFDEHHGETPIFVMAQTFDDLDPRPLGFDAAIEFPPHKLTRGLPQAFDALDVFDEAFEADVFAYDDVVSASLSLPAPDFPLIKTAVPSWDNDARRQGKGLTLVGATPDKFARWLAELIVRDTPIFGARIVAVNAWNEWSEGAYLEPDVHQGAANLNAVQRVVFGHEPEKLGFAVVGEPGATAARLTSAFGLRAVAFARAEDPAASGLAAALVQNINDAQTFAKVGLRVACETDAAAFQRDDRVIAVFADQAERNRARRPPGSLEIASDAGVRNLFAALFPGVAKVSAVLHIPPGAKPSRLRLASLFAQTHPLWEILIIDETGSEAALDLVEAAARAADRDLTMFLDAPVRGQPTPWARALEAASGDFVWLMAPDGGAEPKFLSRVAAPLLDDPLIVMSYCDSALIDAEGRRLVQRPSPLAPRIEPLVDGVHEGSGKNRPKGLGATVWRLSALRATWALLGDAASHDALLRMVVAAPRAHIRHVADALDLLPAPRR